MARYGRASRKSAIVLAAVSVFGPLASAQHDQVFAHLVKIAANAISLEPGRENHKPNYLIKLRVGTTESVVLYHVAASKDGMHSFNENAEVRYRVAGKNVFLTAADGTEIKTLQCYIKGEATICGDDIFPNM
jgi:hypothetical protein